MVIFRSIASAIKSERHFLVRVREVLNLPNEERRGQSMSAFRSAGKVLSPRIAYIAFSWPKKLAIQSAECAPVPSVGGRHMLLVGDLLE